jgi:hypothetical protein
MMKFFYRKEDIDPGLRRTFERYGVVGMQVVLGSTNYFLHEGKAERVGEGTNHEPLMLWLSEQFARAEVKETWSTFMEAAITIFVAVEVIPAVVSVWSYFTTR